MRHDDPHLTPCSPRASVIRAAVQLVGGVEGLRLALTSALGDRFTVKLAGDGRIVGPSRRWQSAVEGDMKRALALALAAVTLVPSLALARDPTPAPTLHPDTPWPSGLELRTDLEAAGWRWGAWGPVWHGGPHWLGDGADNAAVVSYSPAGGDLSIGVWLRTDEVTALWPSSVTSDWTAAMEVMEHLPIDGTARTRIMEAVLGEDHCVVHPLPGGSVMVEHYSVTFPDLVSIQFRRSQHQECPDAPTLEAMTCEQLAGIIERRSGEIVGEARTEWLGRCRPDPDPIVPPEPEFAAKAKVTNEDDPEATYALTSGRYRMQWSTTDCEQVNLLVKQVDGDFEYTKPSRSSFASATINDLPEGVYIIQQLDEACTEWSVRLDRMSA